MISKYIKLKQALRGLYDSKHTQIFKSFKIITEFLLNPHINFIYNDYALIYLN